MDKQIPIGTLHSMSLITQTYATYIHSNIYTYIYSIDDLYTVYFPFYSYLLSVHDKLTLFDQ
jgi:hypothetical protein